MDYSKHKIDYDNEDRELEKINAEINAQLNAELIQAAASGNEAEVLKCINAGASVYATTQNDLTPLMAAAQNGHASVVGLLLAYEAERDAVCDVNDGNHSTVQKNAVFFAAEFAIKTEKTDTPEKLDRTKKSEALLALLNAGANMDPYLLQSHVPTQNKNLDLSNPIIWAAYVGLTKVLDYFLKNSNEVNPIETVDFIQGRTPLVWSVLKGHIDTVNFLIESGANSNLTVGLDGKPQTLVEFAIQHSTPEMVKFLLFNPKVLTDEELENNKLSYLILAIRKRDVNMVRAVLKTKPDLSAILSIAIEHCSNETIHALLDAGADPEFVDGNGMSSLQYLFKTEFRANTSISKEDIDKHPDTYNLFFRLISAVSNETIKKFINLDTRNELRKKIVALFDEEMRAIRIQQLAAFGSYERLSLVNNKLVQKIKEIEQELPIAATGVLQKMKDLVGNAKDTMYDFFGLSSVKKDEKTIETTKVEEIEQVKKLEKTQEIEINLTTPEKEPLELPYLPVDLVKLIMMSQSNFYPNWYLHRAEKDIEIMLNNITRVQVEAAKRKEAERVNGAEPEEGNQMEIEMPKSDLIIFSGLKRKVSDECDYQHDIEPKNSKKPKTEDSYIEELSDELSGNEDKGFEYSIKFTSRKYG